MRGGSSASNAHTPAGFVDPFCDSDKCLASHRLLPIPTLRDVRDFASPPWSDCLHDRSRRWQSLRMPSTAIEADIVIMVSMRAMASRAIGMQRGHRTFVTVSCLQHVERFGASAFADESLARAACAKRLDKIGCRDGLTRYWDEFSAHVFLLQLQFGRSSIVTMRSVLE